MEISSETLKTGKENVKNNKFTGKTSTSYKVVSMFVCWNGARLHCNHCIINYFC